jgi:hypothetical protein
MIDALLAPNIKKATALENVSDLLVFMHVPNINAQLGNYLLKCSALFIEGLQLGFVEISEAFLGDRDDISVLVVSFLCNSIDLTLLVRRNMPVQYSDGLQNLI